MNERLERIEQALADLLQSGLSTRSLAAVPEFHALAEECERVGLHTGASLLNQLESALTQRSYAIQKNDIPITALICRLAQYLDLCREKMQEELIEQRWREQLTKEESL